MLFAKALAVAAMTAGVVSATYANGTVVYTTDIYTAYTTVCPEATSLTFNGVTYAVTESTTLTITNCPCTVVKPVTTSSTVICSTCAPTAPVYVNSTTAAITAPAAPATTSMAVVGTTSAITSTGAAATTSPFAGGANKAVVISGGSLAGLIGFAAYFL